MTWWRAKETLGFQQLPPVGRGETPAERRARRLRRQAGCLWVVVAVLVVGYLVT